MGGKKDKRICCCNVVCSIIFALSRRRRRTMLHADRPEILYIAAASESLTVPLLNINK